MAIRPGAFSALGEDDRTGGNATIALFSLLSVLLLRRFSDNKRGNKEEQGRRGWAVE